MIANRLWSALLAVGLVATIPACDPSWALFTPPWKRFVLTFDMAGGVDTSRIAAGDGDEEVWLRFVYPKPRSIGNPPIAYSVVEVREAVRCASGLARNEKLLIRDARNDSVWGMAFPSPQWQTFAGTGFGDGVFMPLCRLLSSR